MLGIGEIQLGLGILDRIAKILKWRKDQKKPHIETIATRFINVLENHGVHRNQIPRFLGHGLTLIDVQNDITLLPKLNEEIIEATCEKFSIRREWLDGSESQIHSHYDFYKDPQGFISFIEKLVAANPDGQLQGRLLAPIDTNHNAEALIVLQEIIGNIGERSIYRHHLINTGPFTYWKSRAYLTACIATAWKQRIYIHGVYLQNKEIKKLAEGSTLLGWQGEGIWELGHTSWHPEDMARNPSDYLKDIDPERENFGIKSALALWLNLDKEGLMTMNFGKDARDSFQQELTKY